jgi:CheY-like chemotaxis protein
MSFIRGLLIRFGLADLSAERSPINIFLLDDDFRRHQWFSKRFEGDAIIFAENVSEAKESLAQNTFDAIFLDHDLLPHHYESHEPDDENTGYAIAHWLHENPQVQRSATIIVHTRNADAAIRMVEKLRESGRTVEYVPFPMLDAKIKNYWKR